MVSFRILYGERGGGGGANEGVDSRAVQRQRIQSLYCRDCRSNHFQQLEGRNRGVVDAMAVDMYTM